MIFAIIHDGSSRSTSSSGIRSPRSSSDKPCRTPPMNSISRAMSCSDIGNSLKQVFDNLLVGHFDVFTYSILALGQPSYGLTLRPPSRSGYCLFNAPRFRHTLHRPVLLHIFVVPV